MKQKLRLKRRIIGIFTKDDCQKSAILGMRCSVDGGEQFRTNGRGRVVEVEMDNVYYRELYYRKL